MHDKIFIESYRNRRKINFLILDKSMLFQKLKIGMPTQLFIQLNFELMK